MNIGKILSWIYVLPGEQQERVQDIVRDHLEKIN